jgi:cyclopropane-fatty-acyl-phospholipid synthase
VTFWDGDRKNYGIGETSLEISFHRPPSIISFLSDPIMAFGEGYMDETLDFTGNLETAIQIAELNKGRFSLPSIGNTIKDWLLSTKSRQKANIGHHYDLGNDFFSKWLDDTMSYSCAYFQKPSDTLFSAQLQKIDHILKKLCLQPGNRLLDIGSGWGWLIIRAAQQYNVETIGITLSEEQYKITKQRIKDLNLSAKVDVLLANYLDLDPSAYKFDRIVSVGMFEHVGKKNLNKYIEKTQDLLVPGGVSLLHTITDTLEKPVNTWIAKYIFPGGYIPSLREIVWMLPDYDFHLMHTESWRLQYALTLDLWHENFLHHRAFVEQKFGKQFFRMWDLYLRACAASFRSSGLNIHQLLFSKGLNNGLPLTFDYLYHKDLI